jgi:class 3 adenylate cyclase
MDPKQKRKLLIDALVLAGDARETLLQDICGGDAQQMETIKRRIAEVEDYWTDDLSRKDPARVSQLLDETEPETVEAASEAQSFLPGTFLAERYRIVAPIGRGGMGEVYRADDLKLDQPVALKFLPSALVGDPKLREALYNEVRQARRVSHRHIGRVHDIGETDGLHFFSMEFIEGENLASLLRRIGRLPSDKALALGCQLCAGLQAAHEEGLLHLDLKPANLMIDERGDLRITDFGLAKLSSEAEASQQLAGTPGYMAPEQWLRRESSKSSDLYAVGLILYEMFTGQRLHAGRSVEEIIAWHQSEAKPEPPSQHVADLPESIEVLILHCLQKDPVDRPASIGAVLTSLKTAAGTPATLTKVPTRKAGDSGKRLAALMFTDLVGSVALQQRLGTAAYMRYVARHDEVFQECLAGVDDAQVLNETGDGFLVRFDDPADAVNTALRLQARLEDEVCEGEHLRIRIGLHLGVVTEMDERIRGEKRAVGMPINLTARIMDLADGRQILMTRAVYEDARNYVREYPSIEGSVAPLALKWESHGLYEFKGNPESIEIFEVGAEGIAPFVPPESGGKAKRAGESPSSSDESTTTLEILSPESIQGSDVLLNYAAIDDQPLTEGKPGWVSELHRNLQLRVEQLSGQKVKIARLPEDSVTPVIEAEVQAHLPHVKAMVSVVSPPFLQSEVCQRGVANFWRGAEAGGGQWVEDKARLLKVLKTAVSQEEMPSSLIDIFSPLLGFEFYEKDAQTGRIREFDEAFGPALKQRFFERVYDLAYDVSQIVRVGGSNGVRNTPSVCADGTRHRVFLAATTSDVQDERDRIRRELLERGHQVFPDGPLPLLSSDAENVVQDCLVDCTIAVHLLGRHYGTTPEDSAESMPALQLRLTAVQAQHQDIQRLVWMPETDSIVDERQQAFISKVQEDATLQHRAELIEGNLNLLKQDLIRCLAPPEAKPTSPQPSAAATSPGTPKLYLVCDPKDESGIEALEDYLFDQGLEVSLPAFDGDDASAAALHQDNLLSCDAVLIYYGAAPKAWVDIKLRELLKAAGYGRETPIGVQGVYVAPPDDRRKERYRSHQASVLRQSAEFAPSAELDAFISQIKEVCV